MEKYHAKCGVDQDGIKLGNKGYTKPFTVDEKVINCCSTNRWKDVDKDYPNVWLSIQKQLKELKKPSVQSEPPNISGLVGKGIGPITPKPAAKSKK